MLGEFQGVYCDSCGTPRLAGVNRSEIMPGSIPEHNTMNLVVQFIMQSFLTTHEGTYITVIPIVLRVRYIYKGPGKLSITFYT